MRGGLFLTHGEAAALDRLALDAATIAGVPQAIIPALGECFALEPGAAPRRLAGPRQDAAELVAPEDWRNRYAAFTSSLDQRLRALPSNSAREQALMAADEALRRAFGSHAPAGPPAARQADEENRNASAPGAS